MNFDFTSNDTKFRNRLTAAVAGAVPLVGAFLATPVFDPSSKAEGCSCGTVTIDEGRVDAWQYDPRYEEYCHFVWEKYYYSNYCYGSGYTYSTISEWCC